MDVESENDSMNLISAMSKEKTMFLISHCLANVVHADQVLVLKDGMIVEKGTHLQLLKETGEYAFMWKQQQELEKYGKEGRENDEKNWKIACKIAKMIRPAFLYMILAIIMGIAGFLCYTFIPVLGSIGIQQSLHSLLSVSNDS